MYYPFFRGKQYELITIRENSSLLKDSEFVPIIEPVKETLSGLARTLREIQKIEGKCVLIANPFHGDHRQDGSAIEALVHAEAPNFPGFSVGIRAAPEMSASDISHLCKKYNRFSATIVHQGFTEGRVLAEALSACPNVIRHVFLEESCGKLYRKHFLNTERVLLRDGFQKRINREYPPLEPFSDLHVTFKDEGMNGFGDFLVIGDDFSETGGPAYAIAIHLTFIDNNRDDEMYIHHFISDRIDTPTDPAGKFAEALTHLVAEVTKNGSPIFKTNAINEFVDLHRKSHYPGLGYVKKLSMQHHIETLAHYFRAFS